MSYTLEGHSFATLTRGARAALLPYDWAEFGVGAGYSTRVLLPYVPAHASLWLLDSWEGLPEDWDQTRPRGAYKADPPSLDHPRARLVQGLYQDTLPEWSRGLPALAFAHLDCDLYSSTCTVLEAIQGLLRPGSVIVFDDHHGMKRHDAHQGRAWKEWGPRIPHQTIHRGLIALAVICL
jgi:predicted O-methyltransferase YrrM